MVFTDSALCEIVSDLASVSRRPRMLSPGGNRLSPAVRAVLIRNAVMNAHLPLGVECGRHLGSAGDPIANYLPMLELLRPGAVEFASLAEGVAALAGIGRKVLEFVGVSAAHDEFERFAARSMVERLSETAGLPPEAGAVLSAFWFPSLTTAQALDEFPEFGPAAAAALFMGRFDAGENLKPEEVTYLSRCGGELLAYAQANPAASGKHRGFTPSGALPGIGFGDALKAFIASL